MFEEKGSACFLANGRWIFCVKAKGISGFQIFIKLTKRDRNQLSVITQPRTNIIAVFLVNLASATKL